MSVVVVTIAMGVLILWPFIDAIAGPRTAKRLGWKTWPVPRRNIITGTLWIAALGFILALEQCALAGPDFCLPWPLTGQRCGAEPGRHNEPFPQNEQKFGVALPHPTKTRRGHRPTP